MKIHSSRAITFRNGETMQTKSEKKYVAVLGSLIDTRRQGYAQKVSSEQLSKHHSSSTVLHVNADRPMPRLESDSI